MNKILKILVWVFPLVAIGLSVSLAMSYFSERGPEITIEFEDARSIEPTRTKVVYRGIVVGSVEKTHLNSEGTKAIATVRMANKTDHLLKDDSRFLIVQPQVGLQGVTGLETLVKGPMIRIEPGKGKSARHFVGIETSEVGTTAKDSIDYFVTSTHADSLGPGDPVFFRGTKIGSIVGTRLTSDARSVVLELAIAKQFVQVVRTNSVFWQKKAVRADLGLFGSNIEIGSLEAMMKGGLVVATPGPAGKIADRGATFAMQPDEPEGWREWAPAL